MYYKFENDDRKFDADEILDYCVTAEYYSEDTDSFDSFVTESEGHVEILGYEWEACEVLRCMSNDAYERELMYWAENQAESAKEDFAYELERMSPGDSIYICDHMIYAYEDDEDEEEGDTDGDEAAVAAFVLLEQKLAKQKEAEDRMQAEQEKVGNDFLSALGVQII